MSGVGFSELVILALIGLIVLGPERLPRVANQIGGWLGQARRMTRVMKRQLEEELDINDKFNIKPPSQSREPSTQPEPAEKTDTSDATDTADDYTAPRDDDDYSPAHAEDDVGTGVNDEIEPDDAGETKLTLEDQYSPEDIAASEAERSALDDDPRANTAASVATNDERQP